MKKLLLASVLAIASFPGYAADNPAEKSDCSQGTKCYADGWAKYCESKGGISAPNGCDASDSVDTDWGPPPPSARVTVTPPYSGPPPIGWVYGPYTMCGDPPRCSMGVVNVQADGLNVRVAPNGPPVMSLVNGTPLVPLQKQGDWLLVAPACDLTPTWAWSWNAGVPLNRCWVYF
jgi:hypothetical protein